MASNFIVGIGGSDLDDLFEALNGNSKIDDVGFSDSNGDLSNKYLGLISVEPAGRVGAESVSFFYDNGYGIIALNSLFQKKYPYLGGGDGPGTGKIFYDKGSYSITAGSSYAWRYLQAYPNDLVSTYKWSVSYGTVGNVAYDYGDGLSCTQAIVDHFGAGSYAASECHVLTGGWYLPDTLDLNMARSSRVLLGLVTDGYYWTCIEDGTTPNSLAYTVRMTASDNVVTFDKKDLFRVRPIRRV